MLPDIIEAYADAMYVATTLRSPPARPGHESGPLADRAELRQARSPGRLARGVSDWLRARFGRALGTTCKPAAPAQPGLIRAQHS